MSSAADMTKWMAHLLDVIQRPSGVGMTVLRELFKERTLLPASMRQDVGPDKSEPILHIGYGMGFMVSSYKGHMIYWHTGDLHGYFSYMLLAPDLDLAVYVAFNGPGSYATAKALTNIVFFVFDLLQGHDPVVNLTMTCPEGYEAVPPTPDPYDDYDYEYPGDDTQPMNVNAQVLLRPIEDYLGVFGHGLLGDLVVAREQERNSLLRMELGRLLVADLIPTNDPYIFKLAPRAPVADTKEWEKEHIIVFKSSGMPVPRSKLSTKADMKNSTTWEELKNSTEVKEEKQEGEAEEKRLLDTIKIRWQQEVYLFKKSVRFDTVFQEEDRMKSGEQGGEEEESDVLHEEEDRMKESQEEVGGEEEESDVLHEEEDRMKESQEEEGGEEEESDVPHEEEERMKESQEEVGGEEESEMFQEQGITEAAEVSGTESVVGNTAEKTVDISIRLCLICVTCLYVIGSIPTIFLH